MKSKLGTAEFRTSQGADVPIEIVWRKNARRLRVRISLKNHIEVSAPTHESKEHCLAFLESSRAWVEKHLIQAPVIFELSAWLRDWPLLSIDGERVPVVTSASDHAGWECSANGDKIVFRVRPGFEEKDLRKLVRSLASSSLKGRSAKFAERFGLKIGGLSVRNQASRWGSCSSLGAISLNWRLVLLEPRLQDYVILHELAHLTEANHSARFWKLLETYDPNRCKHERELHQVGPQIMRVGR